ncbi:hypothetical protein CDW99_004355 [Salmonella enterica subsp. enterica serovar Ealing]|uniref:Uncharacterized protein n=1 Tax=Salmonella enterica I TaxID=59201 RepID=A0A3R1AQC5_SALET|nr:hypothetical protein [Salmonella enterica]EBQ9004842.1 hypothetical protein [Salmonella enterica subsp. enterica serovar Blockley]EBY7078645.1 hypothetical protein [Salmonella enterica subsp. enterica serovar Ealing]ECD2094112.1 hypothetical protein [Salmonella enterica subsp. enterica serovar Poano]MJV86301.1 hypothetical protein [Salmonella enterica subsp. enterica serovar Oranienburg]MML53990.1 hypothetical protein [Salmonella enterica subsp. enterica serovar Kidderminster]
MQSTSSEAMLLMLLKAYKDLVKVLLVEEHLEASDLVKQLRRSARQQNDEQVGRLLAELAEDISLMRLMMTSSLPGEPKK